MKKIFFIIGVILFFGLGIFMISNTALKTKITSEKITVITTLYPLYDFAKIIGGNKVEVTLLLPPGVEAHVYEPKPSDIAKINSAQIFVYTGKFMEPWADDIIKSVNKKVKIVDASENIKLMNKEEEHDHEKENEDEEIDHHQLKEDHHHHHHNGVDPHIWLDFVNAKIMAENIAKALYQINPQNTKFFQKNLKDYQSKLTKLDNVYKSTLTKCKSKTIVYGGHYAFGYLAKRYGLNYSAAVGFSPDAEPTAQEMILLVERIKKEKLGHIFYEELTSPKIAETLAKETNAKLLLLNGAHNLTKKDYEADVSFILLMENNLKNLEMGLGCS